MNTHFLFNWVKFKQVCDVNYIFKSRERSSIGMTSVCPALAAYILKLTFHGAAPVCLFQCTMWHIPNTDSPKTAPHCQRSFWPFSMRATVAVRANFSLLKSIISIKKTMQTKLSTETLIRIRDVWFQSTVQR